MKNTVKALFAGLLCLAFHSAAHAADGYQQLADEITAAGAAVQGKKIAVIPFSYADGRAGATKDGSVISERLTMKLINMHKFEIIERSVLDKVMSELKLQASGIIDAGSAQQLGKVLGVEAIITRTLVETSGGLIEVNARLIKTETAQAIGASQVKLEKDWVGDAPAAPQGQEAYEQPAATRAHGLRGRHEYGFVDVFMGFGAPNMKLEFSNSKSNIMLNNTYTNDLGIKVYSFITNRYFKTVAFDKLSTEGFGPAVVRAGRFGKGALGGVVELSYEKRNMKKQSAAWRLNGSGSGSITFANNDYATVKSFGVSGGLLMRHAGERLNPYLGLGIGLSINSITLPYVKGYTESSVFSRPVEDLGLGLMLQLPAGLRIKLGDNTQLVAEFRYEINRVFFDRGNISGESDTITLSGARFLAGLGFTF